MKPPRKRAENRRRTGSVQKRSRSVLEVTVRSKAAAEKRNRFLLAWACRLFLAAAVVVGSCYGVREGLRHFIWENPEYNLAVVEINNDGPALPREIIMNAAGLRIGQNVFSFSLAKAREAVAALPQVDRVEMLRVLPNKVTIDLSERHPVAWVADSQTEDPSASDRAFLIDAKRVVFKPKRRMPDYLKLPAICGVQTENYRSGSIVDQPEVRSAMDLIQRNCDSERFQIQSVDISKGYCMIVTDEKRTQVTFPLENVDRQLDRLGSVLDRFSSTHKEIQTVNLLVERNIPVTFAPAVGQDPDVAESTPVVAENGRKSVEAGATTPHPAVTGSGTKTAEKSSAATRKKPLKKPKPGEAGTADSKPARKKTEPSVRRAQPAQAEADNPTNTGNTTQTLYSASHGKR